MQLAITLLGQDQQRLLTEILSAVSDCNCKVIDLRATRCGELTMGGLLIEGNWNHIAKFENTLSVLEKRFSLKIQMQRIEKNELHHDKSLAYAVETFGMEQNNVLSYITAFLFEREIVINEISSCTYQAPYTGSPVLSTKLIIFIPAHISFLRFREDFFDFCDNLNVDVMLDIIKR
ncbi:MAG: glycine cleavage system protein R [Gammaproteobacteria bacterium]